jgi:DNA-binding NarL/FixJ family response regulator
VGPCNTGTVGGVMGPRSDNRRRISFACSRSAQIADGKAFLSRRLRYRLRRGHERRLNPHRGAQACNPGRTVRRDNALSEAVSARKLWPDSKIILLHESLSPTDFQKLLTSEINGCVPLFASPDTLISMLDMIVTRDVRVMVVGDAKCPVSNLQSDSADHEDVSVSIGALQHIQPLANGANVSDSNVNNGRALCVPLLQNHPELSDRKARILDCLVKEQANKVIARTCEITEATVKVHMTSFLRKIRVENRHAGGYLGDEERLCCRRI